MVGNDPRNANSSTLRGLRVLVIEHGWQVADALELSLESMGLVVAGPAATTAEAQRLTRECSPDLAVVDVNLRGEMADGAGSGTSGSSRSASTET